MLLRSAGRGKTKDKPECKGKVGLPSLSTHLTPVSHAPHTQNAHLRPDLRPHLQTHSKLPVCAPCTPRAQVESTHSLQGAMQNKQKKLARLTLAVPQPAPQPRPAPQPPPLRQSTSQPILSLPVPPVKVVVKAASPQPAATPKPAALRPTIHPDAPVPVIRQRPAQNKVAAATTAESEAARAKTASLVAAARREIAGADWADKVDSNGRQAGVKKQHKAAVAPSGRAVPPPPRARPT